MAHQPQLTLALSLLAVSPDIGGLLIRGDRGAAKSTAARGLAALLPGGGPFVNLPLGATEDRVVGTLDLEAALRGEARLQAGLLAQAHGGLLYIDEVNLLPDHLVDVLLDAAAMGVVRVQRDNLSAEQPARFALIGSMNPEEGPLRPQFLDRFGLCVDVLAPLDPTQRAEIVRRRMAFEQHPSKFAAQWQAAEDALQARLDAARQRLGTVHFPDEWLDALARLTTQAGVRSLRADLVLYRAARAYAALEGRAEVLWQDIEQVAPLVLLHRQEPHKQEQDRQQPPPPPQPPTPEPDDGPAQSSPSQGNQEEIYAPSAGAPPLPLLSQRARGQTGQRPAQVVRTVSDPTTTRLHLPATLRASALSGGQMRRQDFQRPVRAQQSGRRVLFVLDSSGSLGLSGRMGLVKGMLLEVLAQQGQGDQVALICFRGPKAELTLDWTDDPIAAEEAIRHAATGGRTPLAHALQLAASRLATTPKAELVLLTDGRANVPLSPASDPWADALSAAQALRGHKSLVVNTERGQVRLGRAAQLAQVLGARLQEWPE